MGSNRYYITGRTSSTVFAIQNSAANGGTPDDTSITFGSQSIAIYRAFNSLSAAESGSANSSHLNTSNLVANKYQLNWTCYGDGADTTLTTIDGWTTGTENYIRIYTPVATSEVGTSQRHDGKWNASAYWLQVGGTGSSDGAIWVQDNHVWTEGIQIYRNGAGYNVYRKLGVDGVYVKVNPAVLDALAWTDENVSLGSRYYYVLRAVDGDGLESVDSLAVSIVLSAPAASLGGPNLQAAAAEAALFRQPRRRLTRI